ncbi:MAG: 50S ribosomal protein L10, partial [Candidatus Hermodarchaeota archaeon]
MKKLSFIKLIDAYNNRELDKSSLIDKLIPFVSGNLAFLFTNMDPFKLGLFLSKNKSNAPARVGQITPKDIVVPAGNTGFQPGPVITQLQNVGIKTRIQ